MANLQDIHQRLEELKRKRRELNRMFKDELAQNEEYKKIVEDLKVLKEKKKSIENTTKLSCFAGQDAIKDVSDQIKVEKELLTDVALNMYVEGQNVEIVDKDTRYTPEFSVKFKKQKDSFVAEQEAERAESHPDRTFLPEGMRGALQPA